MSTHTAPEPDWRTDTIDAPQLWYLPVSGACLAELLRFARAGQTQRVTDLRPGAQLRATCEPVLRPAREALERGRGFAILRMPMEHVAAHEATAVYWLLGHILGEPVAQNIDGVLLYDVRDTGQDLARGARFSVTNYESSFHTDNSFGEAIVDYVGLLCLGAARAGGLSQVVSGYAAREFLRREAPDALEVLSRPFHVDRRGGIRPGEAPTARFPVIADAGGRLVFRYLRYWIEAGHGKAGEPLTAEQVRALNVLDGVLARPELRAEFALEPGDMFFINNRWILHNRTAFEDYPDPDRRRHLVRLWLCAASATG
jgi:alpha-ketoglutarate-dependent taurine dioxygenase